MKSCPNCGAPIQHYYNYHCEYCGTFLKNTEEDIKKFKNYSVGNIKIEILDDYLHNGKIIKLYGNLVPKCNYYEESFKNVMVISSDNIKKVGYSILIPYGLIRNNNFGEIERYIFQSTPEVFKESIDEILNKLFKKIYRF